MYRTIYTEEYTDKLIVPRLVESLLAECRSTESRLAE